jgi:alcohol dehydrogenase class IV
VLTRSAPPEVFDRVLPLRPAAPVPRAVREPAAWPAGVTKYLVPELVFGAGVLDQVGCAARRLGAVRPMLVTDAGVLDAGWAALAQGSLRAAGLFPTTWSAVTPNPKDTEVVAGAQAYLASGCDVLVAVGGGSAIDAAKAIAVLVSNGGDIFDYEGIDRIPRPIPPLVAAPTTAGTGADVSQFAVITDTGRRLKATLIGKTLVPDISLTDPQTLVTMPEWLAATTGLDALTHGVEAYVSRAASFLTDEHALSAVALVGRYLVRTVHAPQDTTARTGMARASLSAGLAFTNAILGAAHAISHQIGGMLDLPHGTCNAVLLPHVVRFNAEHDPSRFRPLGQALGLPDAGLVADDEIGDQVAQRISAIATSIGAPRSLSEIGVTAQDLPALAAQTLCDACLTTNPRDVSEADVLRLLRAAL